MRKLLTIVLVLLTLNAMSQKVQVVVSFNNGLKDLVFEVEATAASIQEFTGNKLRKYYRKEILAELEIYYELSSIAIIYAGDTKLPFLIEYGDKEYESFLMNEIFEWFFIELNQ